MRDRYANLRQGLVGAWCPSIAGSGFTLPDLSGYGHHGTLTNMASNDWVSSQYGRTLDFDGSDDSIRCASRSFLGLSQIAVSVWFLLRAESPRGLIGQWESNNFGWIINTSRFSAYDVGFFAFVDNSGVPNFPNIFTAGNALAANAWNHLVINYKGTEATNANRVEIFINGQKQSGLLVNQTSTGDFPATLSSASIQLWIGAQQNTNDRTVDGQIAESRIWNRSLTESEIRILAQRPGIGLTTQRRTVAYYAPPSFNAGRLRRQQLIGSGVY